MKKTQRNQKSHCMRALGVTSIRKLAAPIVTIASITMLLALRVPKSSYLKKGNGVFVSQRIASSHCWPWRREGRPPLPAGQDQTVRLLDHRHDEIDLAVIDLALPATSSLLALGRPLIAENARKRRSFF